LTAASKRRLDGEIRGGYELNAARYSCVIASLHGVHEGVAFCVRPVGQSVNFVPGSAFEQLFAKRQPVVVTGNQSHQHYGLNIVFQQTLQSLERSATIAGNQLISQLEI
jgi:hypothetical protein